MARKPCCDDHMNISMKRGPWTPEEDRKLRNFIMRNGHDNWRALPKEAGLLRCGKSCRLRWTNYLRPDIKRGNFTEQEENTIIKLQESLGNKWSKIASQLPGRTDNEIKNIWNTYLKKRSLELKSSSISNGDEQNGFTVSSSSLLSAHSPMSKVHDNMVCCMENMLENTDHDGSSFFTSNNSLAPPLSHFGVHENKDLETESGQSRSWLTNSEFELGFQETKTSYQETNYNQKNILPKDDAVEAPMVTDNDGVDPIPLYFQMWPPSPHNFTL